jgi:hypothetical protein
VARSRLADANESHDWRIFADFAQVLSGIARPLYAHDQIGVCYRGLIGTPKTKNSRRTLPRPESLKDELKRLSEKSASGEHLVF